MVHVAVEGAARRRGIRNRRPLLIIGSLVFGAGLLPKLVGATFGFLILVMPEVMLNSRADDRQKAIQLALPDTLDRMTIAVEAGLCFEAAMAKAAQGSSSPLSEELIRTLQDMSIGRSRTDAYSALLARTDTDDLKRFSRAVQQAGRYGIAVADVLRVHAGEMRIKRRQSAEESVFPLVFAILPVLFIVLLYPAAIGIIGVCRFSNGPVREAARLAARGVQSLGSVPSIISVGRTGMTPAS